MKMNTALEGATDTNRATAIPRRRSFPLRTLMVCFTTWLIATEVLIFDEVKFMANAELLEQAARALRAPQGIVPNERPSDFTSDGKMHKL
jgi:zona occludens toxin (predicted ATPase)